MRNELLLTNKWSTVVFLGIFAVSTALILFYFNLLYAIQKELEDPFGDDFSDLKAHREARDAAAAAAAAGAPVMAPSTFQNIPPAVGGVGGTTANGLACAQQLLDDWCAMTDLERQEAIAFRDWYSPNIQP